MTSFYGKKNNNTPLGVKNNTPSGVKNNTPFGVLFFCRQSVFCSSDQSAE
jgi:hypothetical protein